LEVSPISLGAMSFGSGFTRETKIDESLAARLVDRALDAGVNLIDTADTYGGKYGLSETILGRVVRDRRDDVLLATKVGFGDLGPRVLSYENIVSVCEASLQRMNVEHIDLMQLHRADRTVPFDESIGALEDLVSRGLVRAFGVSNHHAFEVAGVVARQRALGRRAITSVQVRYSLVAREVEHEILPYCRTDDIGVLVFSPLAGGQLTGWTDTPGAAGRRKMGALPRVEQDVLRRARAVVHAIARGRDVSMARVALAWVLAQPGVSSVIVGPSTVDQLNDNLLSVDLALDDEELADLSAATELAPIYPASTDRAWGFAEPGGSTATPARPGAAPWLAET
jgi:aryl-alcohol dehydrogenase-like predicted oxidoreductase